VVRQYIGAVVLVWGLVFAGAAALAQSPNPTPTPFDGHYIGTSTLSGADTNCATITKIGMNIINGQVAIREYHLDGKKPVYHGTVDATGAVSAQNLCTMGDIGGGGAKAGCFIIHGTISGNTFTGDRHMGAGCWFKIQMTKDRSAGNVETE
jgi:hypothetical protein